MPPKHPWFVAQKQNLAADLIFYNIHDPLSHYQCQIPELVGKHIRGCFHGCWVLLSSNHPRDVIWSIWNPINSEVIDLPPLNRKGLEDDISYCCLSAPPDDPNSVLLLMRNGKPNFVYCSLGQNAKEFSWTESTYANQIKMIIGSDGSLHCLTCCNGKVYAFVKKDVKIPSSTLIVVEVSIVVNNDCKSNKLREEVAVINLLPVLEFLELDKMKYCSTIKPQLTGSCTELFIIVVGLKTDLITVGGVNVFKLDMNNMMWEEMKDLKGTILSMTLFDSDSPAPFYSPAIATTAESGGGYIHILAAKGKIIYSYHVKDKTISLSFIPSVVGAKHVSAWAINGVLTMKEFCAGFECLKLSPLPYVVGYESRFESDNDDSKQKDDKDADIVVGSIKGDDDESHILKLPPHVLEKLIMEFCVGVEYLKFRSTCKHCHLAAPLMPWKASMRLQNDSLLSPLLIVFHKHKDIITLTDPVFGDTYFIKTPQELICDFQIKCSRYGWLLILKADPCGSLVFFNPFTSDILELPESRATQIFSFSAPPTSPDCMVAGVTTGVYVPFHVTIHNVGKEQSWHRIRLNVRGGKKYYSVAFNDRDLYALRDDGGLDVLKNIGREDYYLLRYATQAPRTRRCTSFPQCFQVMCDRDILRVIVGKSGESVEVFKIKSDESTIEWVKLDSLGKRMIFIYGTSSFCLDAKTPQMENKIYFPRIPLMYYSLKTCRFHNCNNKNIQDSFGDFFGTKHYLTPHGWIEPMWS